MLAKNSYRDTRFHFDRRFPSDLSSLLYQEWISKSCNGYADHVLTAELNEVPVGYISCHLTKSENSGKIGLIGVSENARGRGVGRVLIQGALDWFGTKDVKSVTVVTQGRNFSAQRLYQSCRFRTQSVHLWYHKWFCNPDGE